MIRKRWVQVRNHLLLYSYWKPIWRDSLIMEPKTRLHGWIWNIVDNKCLLKGDRNNET